MCGCPAQRAQLAVALWLGLTLLVGGQAAYYQRPMFGLRASRCQAPPRFLGAEADVRGATNFYEIDVRVQRAPPVPPREIYPQRR